MILAGLVGSANGQQTMSLEDAIRLAKQNNGTIRAARLDIDAAKARRKQAYSQFLPTITPQLNYQRSEQETGNATIGNQRFTFEQTSTQVGLNWRLLDSGQRLSQLRASREGEAGSVANARQTLRQTLFTVEQTYLDTLRAQELAQLAEVQLKRAEAVLEQTKVRVKVGDAAKREILQAQADTLNASVTVINAKNRVETSAANLRAQIGAQGDLSRPNLSAYKPSIDSPTELKKAVEVGTTLRPDLISQRYNLASQTQSLKATEINAGVTWSLDYSASNQFSPFTGQNQNLAFLLSYPLFDGGLRRANVQEQRAGVASAAENLKQAERNARAEIEGSYITFEQNQKRVEAAEKALEAAKLNFEATEEARRLGASDLIEVLTAQVSLATAESNLIESKYDLYISQLRLQLVTGMPLPGEEN